jgi:hypothetical protein
MSAEAKQQPEWQFNVDWSIGNMGLVEGIIQTEWERLDVAYPGTNVKACVGGNGRACAMTVAIDAAKHKFDQKAYEITISTQLHNPHAADTIRAAQPYPVAEYLRGKP